MAKRMKMGNGLNTKIMIAVGFGQKAVGIVVNNLHSIQALFLMVVAKNNCY